MVKIRLKGQGESGINGGANGDLYLTVKMRSKAREKLEGIDITTKYRCFHRMQP